MGNYWIVARCLLFIPDWVLARMLTFVTLKSAANYKLYVKVYLCFALRHTKQIDLYFSNDGDHGGLRESIKQSNQNYWAVTIRQFNDHHCRVWLSYALLYQDRDGCQWRLVFLQTSCMWKYFILVPKIEFHIIDSSKKINSSTFA